MKPIISYTRFSPYKDRSERTDQVVKCYQDVFADAPWNEWKKCSVCDKFWGTKDLALLEEMNFQHCGVPLQDYWQKEKVTEDLFNEITEKCSCWIAMCGTKVIGFTWGYEVNIEYLEKKLDVSFREKFVLELDMQSKIAYQDEVGVISEFREQGIAKMLVRLRLADFVAQDLKVGVVRTRQYPEASKTFLWYDKIGYKPIFQYPKEDGRVILARKLDDLRSKLK